MCRSCAPGTQPSSDKGRCDPCSQFGDNSHSTDGVACSSCQAGSNPNADRTACVSCNETGDAYHSINGERCSKCDAGNRPAVDRSSCQACSAVDDGYFYSADGAACIRCDAGSKPTNDRKGCDVCIGQFSEDGRSCENCPDGKQPVQNLGAPACIACEDLTLEHNALVANGSLPGSPVGMISVNGADCAACIAGKMPNDAHTQCVECAAGNYSVGDQCRSCGPGTAPSADASRCDSCLMQGASAYSSDGRTCRDCAPGTEPLANLTDCQPCAVHGPQYVSANGEVCSACAPGKAVDDPSMPRMCLDCVPGKFSEDGAECTHCEPGTQPNGGKTGCENCPANQYFDVDLSLCKRCDAGFQLNDGSTNETSNCVRCPSGRAGSAGTCAACTAGQEPNQERTACGACSPGAYSAAGVVCIDCGLDALEIGYHSPDKTTCMQCLPGKAPTQTRDACTPCPDRHAGGLGVCHLCPDGTEPDANSFECQDCGVGTAGRGGSCDDCPPGSEPLDDGTECRACQCKQTTDTVDADYCTLLGRGFAGCQAGDACAPAQYGGDYYSPLGRECTSCKAGQQPNEGRTECLDCPEGRVSPGDECAPCPAGSEPSSDKRECASCVGRSKKHSTDGALCRDCPPGSEPLPNATACVDCARKPVVVTGLDGTVRNLTGGPLYSSDGSACVACQAGYQPAADRTTCVLCGAINASDPYYFSSDGVQCEQCSPGFEVNPQKTGCDVCVGKFSADGKQCGVCPHGSQPTETFGAAACVSCAELGRTHNNAVDNGTLSGARVGKISMNGAVCSDCAAGKMPNSDNTECEPCGDGEYSVGDKCRRCAPGTETSQDKSRCDSCLVQGAASFSPDGVECQDCWENSEPFGPFNRSGCVCQPGFTANGTQVCVDIDECAVETSYSAAGVCTGSVGSSTCYTYDPAVAPADPECGCCHRYSSGCVNTPGSFQCLPCLAGFEGSSYGVDGCALPAPTTTSSTIGCDGVPLAAGGLTTDMCGLCGGDNSTCADCLGHPNGAAKVDRCGVCAPPESQCQRDCEGTWGGSSALDACLLCNGDNSSCLDCAGNPNGRNAFDRCGDCVAPEDACVRDCSGVWAGGATNDVCSVCGGDGSSCTDCAGVAFGSSVVDRCSDCVALSAKCQMDCAGVWGGSKVVDVCGICHGDGTACLDCAGVPHGRSTIDQCGACVPKSAACSKDCAGDWGGDLVVDKCGVCGGDGVCREAVRISIEIPGAVSEFDDAAKSSIRNTVANAIGLELQYVSITSLVASANEVEETVEISFELRVERTSDASGRRRRLQWGDLASGLASGVASATGVDLDKVTAGTPVEVVIDCHGQVGGDAIVDACGLCGGDNSTCHDCAGVRSPMRCALNGTDTGEVPQRAGLANVWQCADGSSVAFSSPGNSTTDNCGTCDDDPANDCVPNCLGNTGAGVGVVPGAADSLVDECGVCEGQSDTCGDCAGVPNGNATVDRCDQCDATAANDCTLDCAGIWGGPSALDACSVCDTNSSNDGISCADCAGVPDGNATTDRCGRCDNNSTNDCSLDCLGVWGGPAQSDLCDVCGGDDSSCSDCLGIPNGLALLDECGTCTNETRFMCIRDCAGVWGGINSLDACGVCDNSTENDGTTCTVDESDVAVPDARFSIQVTSGANFEALAETMASEIGVPASAIEVIPSAAALAPPNRSMEVQLNAAVEDVSNATAEAAFVTAFVQDIAALLGVAEARVVVDRVAGGSVIVEFTVMADSDGTPLATLDHQLVLNATLAGSDVGDLTVHPAPVVAVEFVLLAAALLEAGAVVSDVLVTLEEQLSSDVLDGVAPGQSLFDGRLQMTCPPGYYSNNGGGSEDTGGSCVRCPLGYEPNIAQDGCESCQRLAVGELQTWVSTNGGACVLCGAGRAPNDARTSCEFCEAGTYNTGDGAACARCDDNTMVPSSTGDSCLCPSASKPMEVVADSFIQNPDAFSAWTADGTFDSTAVELSCFEQEFSDYRRLGGMVPEEGKACMSCSQIAPPGVQCAECIDGVPLALDGWSLSKRGMEAYMQGRGVGAEASNGTNSSAPHRDLFKCPYDGACLGYEAYKRDNLTNSSLLMRCAAGYTGVLCGLCEPTYHRTDSGCVECTSQGGAKDMAAGLIVAAALPLIFIWRVVIKPRLEMQMAGLPGGSENFQDVGMETKFKIGVSLFQVIGSFPFTLSLKYPIQFMSFLSYIKVIFLDIVELVRVDCLMETSLYVNTLMAALLLPGILALLALQPCLSLLTKSGRKSRRDGTWLHSFINRGFFVVFMLYPYLSKTAFRAHACRELVPAVEGGVDKGESYHQDYMEVDCTGDKYVTFKLFAWAMVGLFPIGLPLFFFLLLYANRNILLNEKKEAGLPAALLGLKQDAEKDEEAEAAEKAEEAAAEAERAGLPAAVIKRLKDKALDAKKMSKQKKQKWWQGGSEKFSFLTRDYKAQYYYFECVELVRKCTLAGVIIFVRPGSIEQAFAAGTASFFFFAIYARAMPFRLQFDNVLKLCAEVQTFMTLFISIILRTAATQGGVLEFDHEYGIMLVLVNLIITPVPLLFGILVPLGCNTIIYAMLCCRRTKRDVEELTPGKYKQKDGEPKDDGPLDAARVLEFMSPDEGLEVEEIVQRKTMTIEEAEQRIVEQERQHAELEKKLGESARKEARLENLLQRERRKSSMMQSRFRGSPSPVPDAMQGAEGAEDGAEENLPGGPGSLVPRLALDQTQLGEAVPESGRAGRLGRRRAQRVGMGAPSALAAARERKLLAAAAEGEEVASQDASARRQPVGV